MSANFEMNGKTYKTDEDTINVLREQIEIAKTSGDYSAVIAIMAIGIASETIVEVK